MEFKLNDYHKNTPDEELLKDIIRVSKILNKETLTIDDYEKNGGKYNHTTISRRFGSWTIALQRCNLTPCRNQMKSIDTENLIEDLQIVAKKLNKRTILTSEYALHGKYSKNVFFRRFGSWNNALIAAGLTPFDHPLGGGTKNKVSEYACLEEIERIWIQLGRQPTTTDIKNGVSRYSLHVYERRFGSWRKALEFFVAYMNGEQEVEKSDDTDDIQFPNSSQQTDNVKYVHKTKRDINLRMRFIVMKRDSFKCCMCGRSPATTPGLELHIDHILPWSKGGETVIDNLQTLCSDCNLGKSNLLEDE